MGGAVMPVMLARARDFAVPTHPLAPQSEFLRTLWGVGRTAAKQGLIKP